jgi:hypothetical protein
MMHPMKRVLILLIAAFGMLNTAVAARIAIRLDPVVTVTASHITARVEAYNWGDETADQLRVDITFNEATFEAAPIAHLPFGQTTHTTLALGPSPATPGIYPVITRVRYTDAKGYPVSKIKVITVTTGTNAPPAERPVTLTLETSPLKRGGTGEIVIVAKSAKSITGTLQLYLPDELICNEPQTRITIQQGETLRLPFTIHNAHGLPGSRYRCAATAEWTDHGQHRTARIDELLTIHRHQNPFQADPWAWLIPIGVLALLWLALLVVRPFISKREFVVPKIVGGLSTCCICTILIWFILDHLDVISIFSNTAVAGGDMVAHSAMAAQLKHSLLTQGRIISWSPGWWGGFPLFQFYFPLPYLVAALASLIMPMNVAIKLSSIMGMVLLPFAALYWGRALKLRHPGPLLMAIATVPFLFDHSHTMWGVNAYSTLAGMIANSVSFSIMLFFLGSTLHDAETGRIRIRTILLLCILIASHFFTSLMAALMVCIIPFLFARSGFMRALRVIAIEGITGCLLMAWWLVPLVAKRQYAVDFGTNWDVDLWSSIPLYLWTLVPFAAGGLVVALFTRSLRFLVLPLWMGIWSGLLFIYGFNLSPVFVNIRLWPFFAFSLLVLGAGGLALLIHKAPGRPLIIATALLVALTIGIDQPNHVRSWAEWNYGGLQEKPRWSVLEELVLPLDGTPGRLANDLHDTNSSLGSSRVFESVPYLIDKPILEGGIVNSAQGSYAAYYIQSETSESCAGYPPLVQPTTQNIDRATQHLTLFNVKHFIARGDRTRALFKRHPDWRKLNSVENWTLYEHEGHDGRSVVVLNSTPAAVQTDAPAATGLQWLVHTNRLSQPVILLDPGNDTATFSPTINQKTFDTQLTERPIAADTGWITNSTPVLRENVTANSITFKTTAIGKPHIIKCNYFPNWKVRGAKAVYRVTPNFMLVIPDQTEVELYYGYVLSDNVGRLLTLCGTAIVAAILWTRRRKRSRSITDVIRPNIHA